MSVFHKGKSKWLMPLIFALVCLVLAFVLFGKDGKDGQGVDLKDKGNLFSDVNFDDVLSVTVTSPESFYQLVIPESPFPEHSYHKVDGKPWSLMSSRGAPINPVKVKSILDLIKNIPVESPVVWSEREQGEVVKDKDGGTHVESLDYGFTPPELKLEFATSKKNYVALIGKEHPMGGFSFIHRVGDDRIWLTPNSTVLTLVHKQLDLRLLFPLDIPFKKVKELELINDDKLVYRLFRDSSESTEWIAEFPSEKFKADLVVVEKIFFNILKSKVVSYIDDPTAGMSSVSDSFVGFAPKIKTFDGQERQLAIVVSMSPEEMRGSKTMPKSFFVRYFDSPWEYEMSGLWYLSFAQPPNFFRDRQIVQTPNFVDDINIALMKRNVSLSLAKDAEGAWSSQNLSVDAATKIADFIRSMRVVFWMEESVSERVSKPGVIVEMKIRDKKERTIIMFGRKVKSEDSKVSNDLEAPRYALVKRGGDKDRVAIVSGADVKQFYEMLLPALKAHS